MTAADEVSRRRDVACPFCGLVCDDLVIATGNDNRLKVLQAGCELSRAGYERATTAVGPRIAGKAATPENAVARAAAILGASRQPLFAGLGTDVAGMRAVMQLADRLGGVVDHMHADGLFRNLRVLQDSGWMTTTLSEIRSRMDVLLIVGPDPAPHFPRFLERCAAGSPMFQPDIRERRLFRLGPTGNDVSDHRDDGVEFVSCSLDHMPAAIDALRCLIQEQPINRAISENLPMARLAEVSAALKSARYGVVAWMAAAFGPPGGELVVQALADLVRDLNRNTRCAGFPLAGADNLIGVNQVCTWQAGVPLRTGFASGAPRHDPLLNETNRLLQSGEADALVWISAFREVAPPAAGGIPTILLSPTGDDLAREPEVFIPVGTPGLDHAGQMFRTDAVVALPLPKLRETSRLSVSSVLHAIDQSLNLQGEMSPLDNAPPTVRPSTRSG